MPGTEHLAFMIFFAQVVMLSTVQQSDLVKFGVGSPKDTPSFSVYVPTLKAFPRVWIITWWINISIDSGMCRHG
tara:strand:+ start:641 stop:862 length:222 start_codon:yes stop_codon:yes gene_type:complete